MSRARRIALAAALVASMPLLVGQGGCDTLDEQPGTVRVDAPPDGCWSGAIGDSTKDGCGSASFEIEGEAIIVANAQKQTEGSWELTLSLEVGGEVVDVSTTTAEFGIAQVSE